jgi:hypothetical protein
MLIATPLRVGPMPGIEIRHEAVPGLGFNASTRLRHSRHRDATRSSISVNPSSTSVGGPNPFSVSSPEDLLGALSRHWFLYQAAQHGVFLAPLATYISLCVAPVSAGQVALSITARMEDLLQLCSAIHCGQCRGTPFHASGMVHRM